MFAKSLRSVCYLIPLGLFSIVAANLACDGSFEFSFEDGTLSGDFTVNDGSDGENGGDTSGSGETGMLRVLVTDKPFPFEFLTEANVTITRVEIRGGDESADDSEESDEPEGDDSTDEHGDGDDDETDPGDSEADPDDGDDTNDDMSDGGEGDDPTQAKAVVFQLDDSSDGDDEDAPDDSGDANDEDDSDDEEGDSDDDENADDDDEGDSEDDGGEEDDSDGGFTVVFEGEQLFNLLDLQNGRTDLLAETEVPAGTYTQMRIFVTEGEVVLTDGRVFPLSVPSGSQSGIKLNFTFEVEADGDTELLLDIDLSRVFNAIPGGQIDDVDGIREFQFRPSLGMRLVNLLKTGSVAGAVTDDEMTPLENVAVTAYDGEDEVTSTSTDPDGTYMLIGLLPGDYRVEFEADGFDVVEVEDVAVVAGEPTEGVDVVLTTGEDDEDMDEPVAMDDGTGAP